MKFRYIGLVVWCGLLSACASQDSSDDNYVGWVCNGARNSDNWSCEMQEIRDGQPAVSHAPVKKVAPAAAPPDESKELSAKTEVAGFPSQDWRKQLPDMTSDPVIPAEKSGVIPKTSQKLPARVAEPLTLGRTDRPKSNISTIEQPQVHAISEPSQPLNASDLAGARSGYTLQLGAFVDEPQLQAFIVSHQLGGLPVKQIRAFSKQQYWQVLTWGEFNSPEEARGAWQAVSERYPGIEPWVRSLSSIDSAAAVSADVDG
ncbi:MAG: hypothetical protein EP323_05275 [Gammaproteobacteria bacterium]|nr:MAG: hypothetical protein EP323_05275 [Gammaproteobacteria bacterium]